MNWVKSSFCRIKEAVLNSLPAQRLKDSLPSRLRPHKGFYDFPGIVEDYDSREGTDAPPLCLPGLLVHVDLDHGDIEGVEDRRQHLAGAAPGSPEVEYFHGLKDSLRDRRVPGSPRP